MEGYHDDLIMSLAMSIFVVQTSFKRLEKIEKQTKAMLESWIKVSNDKKEEFLTNSNKTHINPFYTNTPTYHPKHSDQSPNDDGEYNWLFGIK
jgi:hypothetical protein